MIYIGYPEESTFLIVVCTDQTEEKALFSHLFRLYDMCSTRFDELTEKSIVYTELTTMLAEHQTGYFDTALNYTDARLFANGEKTIEFVPFTSRQKKIRDLLG